MAPTDRALRTCPVFKSPEGVTGERRVLLGITSMEASKLHETKLAEVSGPQHCSGGGRGGRPTIAVCHREVTGCGRCLHR